MRYCNRKEYLKSKAKQYRRNNPEKRLFQRAKSRAKQRGILFSIDLSDIVIPTYCPILGIELKLGTNGKVEDASPSLDRINSSLGYIKGNVAVISNRANVIKSNGTIETFQNIVEYMKMAGCTGIEPVLLQ